MKLFEIKEDVFLIFKIFGKTAFYMSSYWGMRASSLDPAMSEYRLDRAGDRIKFVEMNEDLINKYDGGDYDIKTFYRSEIGKGFFGIALVEEGGKVLGYVCGSDTFSDIWKKYSASPRFYIKYVYVAPDCRGKHFARYLVSELGRRMPEEKTLSLMVRCNNKSAIRTYEQLGFEKMFIRRSLMVDRLGLKVGFSRAVNKKR